AVKISLQYDADIAVFAVEPFEYAQCGAGLRRIFHVDPHEVVVAFGRLDYPARIPQTIIFVNVQSQLGQLDRDVGIDADVLDTSTNAQVFAHVGFRFGPRRRAFAQMVEGRRHTRAVEFKNRRDRVVDVFAGDEAARDLAKSREF